MNFHWPQITFVGVSILLLEQLDAERVKVRVLTDALRGGL